MRRGGSRKEYERKRGVKNVYYIECMYEIYKHVVSYNVLTIWTLIRFLYVTVLNFQSVLLFNLSLIFMKISHITIWSLYFLSVYVPLFSNWRMEEGHCIYLKSSRTTVYFLFFRFSVLSALDPEQIYVFTRTSWRVFFLYLIESFFFSYIL